MNWSLTFEQDLDWDRELVFGMRFVLEITVPIENEESKRKNNSQSIWNQNSTRILYSLNIIK